MIYRHQIFSGDQTKKNEIGKASSTYGETTGAYRILVGKHEGRNHLENPGVDGSIILELYSRGDTGVEAIDWIYMTNRSR
jgi:hypothetical protein